MGDSRAVEVFINQNSEYVYEVEFYGKTALSYACYYNQTDAALQILRVGVNSDLKCHNGRTSLFYALSSGNVVLVKALLQRGANPWSTPANPYNTMLASSRDEEMQCLFHNARKVYLGMQIQRTISNRKTFWTKFSPKISEYIRLQYNPTGDELLEVEA